MEKNEDKIILIDGNSLINRAFYATPLLTAPDGRYTNAVYAFVNMLIKLISERKPQYILVAFDRKEPTFRHEAYSEYKGTRKPMPEELVPQIPLLKDVLDALGIAHYEQAGIEADDIIGAMSVRNGLFAYIVTGDKDSFQLVSDSCTVLYTKRGISDVEEYSIDNFEEKTGIKPSQIKDLKGLMGDSSDNIPGVKGIGEKTALSLLKQFGTIETLYERIDEVAGKNREKLLADKEWAIKSKQLATIAVEKDLTVNVEDCKFVFPFPFSSRSIFTELSLNNILKKQGVFDDNDLTTSDIQKREAKIVTIKTKKEIPSVVKSDKIAVYIGDSVCFYDGDKEYLFCIDETLLGEGFSFEDAVRSLDFLFSDSEKTIIVYGKKQLKKQLIELNFTVKAKIDDLLLIKYLVDYTGKEETVEDVLKVRYGDMKNPSLYIYELFEELYGKASVDERKIYNEIELPLADVLYDIENEGFRIDIENLDVMSKEYGEKISCLSNEINTLAGTAINLNSTKQLSELLYDKLQLKHGKKNKNGFSTDVDVLENLVDEHPIIPLLLKYRKYTKILSTYIDGFRPLIDKKTGLVHTTFLQAQTATGRLSSRKPNLQNIPVRDDEGREIRKLFSAKTDDRVLVDADYSQIELRLLAEYSGCKPLIDAFKSGRDIHTETAANVFGVDSKDVTPLMRRRAKAVNFGIIYGISEFGLAKSIGVKPKEAGAYMKTYFETYPEVKTYMQNNIDKAKKTGYAETVFGRRRYIRELNSSSYNLRSFGERAAMNMPLQGSAADIIKVAMINVHNRLLNEGLKSKLILQVHDELIVDAFIDEKDVVVKILREEMENAVRTTVPLTVSVSVAENWYDCK